MNTNKRIVLNLLVAIAMVVGLAPLAQPSPVEAISPNIVISQVYGGNGNTYKNDFVELFNRGNTAVSLDGWSIQYASATGTGNFSSNAIAAIAGSLAPGQYYLVQLAAASNGASLPTPDATGTVNLSATAGKVALVNTTTGLPCNGGSTVCSASDLAKIIDLVGYGSANFYEGSAAAPAPSSTTAVLRGGGGCTDTDDNGADFSAGTPTPRNTASSTNVCSTSTNPSGTGTADPASVMAGGSTLLTVAVTPGTNPTSTGLAVTGDLSSIGGSATQPFFDDGTSGDAVAGDNVFSFQATVSTGTAAGAKSLPVSITDAQARSGSATIDLTVQASASTNPSGTGAADPASVVAGSSTLLTVAVTPGTNPTSTGLAVTGDLVSIGGSATQQFFDDGTNGDAVAGDNVFSFQATVASGTAAGAKSLPLSITDAQARFGSAMIALTVSEPTPTGGDVVISQVYGGGGNSGAFYKNDFIELYNRTANAIDLTGWTVQYASASGTSWSATPLAGSIAPGKYYLVQEAAGAGGTVNLPTPDAVGSIAMSASSAKVALVTDATALSGSCPAGVNIMDFVGFGTANCYEGSGAAPGLSNTTAALRKSDGTQDTDNNSADFVAGTPNPRNSLFPFAAIGLATPPTVLQGETTLLTVAVTPGTNPDSTGITVSCNLSPIGGAANQALYDDGTNGDQVADDNTFSFTATGTLSSTQNLMCTFADAQGRSGTTTINLTVLAVLPIGTVNGPVGDTDDGTAHTSPYVGQIVMIKGVIYEKTLQAISGSANTYKGFYIQNTAATADADSNTSNGIFVFMSTTPTMTAPSGTTYTPLVGDEIILSGKVSEYYNMTELQNPTLVRPVVRSGVDIEAEVPPVVANPPASLADANRYWERLQGMRVQVPQNSIVLGGRNVFSPADAEVWVAHPDSTIAQRVDPYTRRAFRDAHPLDDNYDPTNWDGNGYRILMGSLGIKAAAGDAQVLINPARTFDTVTNAPAGGLNYTYSKYRIEISEQPTFEEGVDPAANNPPSEFDRSIHYTIADYNLENLYDYRDNPFSGCDFANVPAGSNAGCSNTGTPFLSAVTPPYDYVPASDADYQARLNDIAKEIINDLHSPDILMVQEVENQDICTVASGALACGTTDNADGKPDVLQELALKIAGLSGPAYDAAFDRDSSDLRGIAPAFLYRTDRVELLPAAGDPVLGSAPVIDDYTAVPYDSDVSNPKTLNAVLPAGVSACETSWVFPRAPDVALFRIYSTAIGVGSHRDVYVIDNHFKSGPDSCVGHRTEQAKYNAALAAFIQASNPDARIVLGGDLNVYPRPDDPFAPIGQTGSSDQLGALYDPSLGLKNLWEVLRDQAPESAYSYVYLGMAQTLDQMFVNQPMLADLQQFRTAHINSDFPADYPDDVARGTSDHDPNVATFAINDAPTANAGGPYTVDEGSSVTLTATGTDPENGPLTYAWDLDNNGTFETPGQSVTFAGVDGPAIQTVKVQVTDNGGLTAVASADVTVNNVPPTVGPIAAPANAIKVGAPVNVSANFTDPGILDTHTATWDWGDGNTSAGTVNETNGSGSANGSHTYSVASLYTVKLTVTDKDGGSAQSVFQYVVVYDPNAGAVTGAGWFNSPAGAYTADPTRTGRAIVAFYARYYRNLNVPIGLTAFQLQAGNLRFSGAAYQWLVIAGSKAELRGSGKINGRGDYGFLVSVIDGKVWGTDKFRIKIWDKATRNVIYDNQMGASDDADATQSLVGSILIYK
jgi:predicted extracellular nuclease